MTGAKVGRPRQYDGRVTTAIRFTPEVHERLRTAAEARDVSMNRIVERAVAKYLDDLQELP